MFAIPHGTGFNIISAGAVICHALDEAAAYAVMQASGQVADTTPRDDAGNPWVNAAEQVIITAVSFYNPTAGSILTMIVNEVEAKNHPGKKPFEIVPVVKPAPMVEQPLAS